MPRESTSPTYAEHKTEPSRLLSLLGDRSHRFMTDEDQRGEHIVEFVFQWFALHTTQVDTQIATFIDAKP